MGFNSKGEFCVGTTTLDTMFRVAVDDYGVDLPEIHARGPMICPQNICVRYIINWLERGLCVSFEKKEDDKYLEISTKYFSIFKCVTEK